MSISRLGVLTLPLLLAGCPMGSDKPKAAEAVAEPQCVPGQQLLDVIVSVEEHLNAPDLQSEVVEIDSSEQESLQFPRPGLVLTRPDGACLVLSNTNYPVDVIEIRSLGENKSASWLFPENTKCVFATPLSNGSTANHLDIASRTVSGIRGTEMFSVSSVSFEVNAGDDQGVSVSTFLRETLRPRSADRKGKPLELAEANALAANLHIESDEAAMDSWENDPACSDVLTDVLSTYAKVTRQASDMHHAQVVAGTKWEDIPSDHNR